MSEIIRGQSRERRIFFSVVVGLLFQNCRPVLAGLDEGNYNEFERSSIHLKDQSWMKYEYTGNESIWMSTRTSDPVYVPCAEARDPSVIPGWTSFLKPFGHSFVSACLHISPASQMESRGLLMFEPDGGLCQIKWAILNAVALARVLNATLVIPTLRPHFAWGDNSTFGEMYNVRKFIAVLKDDIRIQRKLSDHQQRLRDLHGSQIQIYPGSEWKGSDYYKDALLPILDTYGMVIVQRFYRQYVPEEDDTYLQQLRCRANYHALQHTASIKKIGFGYRVAATMIQQLRGSEGTKKFVAVHFRFEPDWLAYSGCLYSKEANTALREWAKNHDHFPYRGNSELSAKKRKRGDCPVTPLDLAIMLKGLGIGSDAQIYMGGGAATGGMKAMAPLLEAFPGQIVTKDMLLGDATMENLRPFSMRMASLDYLVLLESDVALLTSSGNFAVMVDGHRYYQSGGTKETLSMRAGYLNSELEEAPLNMDRVHKRMQMFRKVFTPDPNEGRSVNKDFYARPRECIQRLERAEGENRR